MITFKSLSRLFLVLSIFAMNVEASQNFGDGKTVLVFAHLDDELLWMEPFLGHSLALVQAGPATAQATAQKMKNFYASKSVYPNSQELIFVFSPISTEQYLNEAKPENRCMRDLKQYSYDNTYRALFPILESLKKKGALRIVTHNPWGEYGHPNHRNVSAVVREIAVKLNLEVWISEVVRTGRVEGTTDALPVAQGGKYLEARHLVDVERIIFDFNHRNFLKARNAYAQVRLSHLPNGAWTWLTGDNEHPGLVSDSSITQSFSRIVQNGKDNLAALPNYYQQILKIRGDVPYAKGEMYSDYLAPLMYNCK